MGGLPEENRPGCRRTVRLELITEARLDSDLPRIMARTACGLRRNLLFTRHGWLCLAERALGDWATTLRAALLMLVGFAGVIVLIGVAFGLGGVVLGALAVAMWALILRVPGLLAAGRSSR
jgi:hypothetical protein